MVVIALSRIRCQRSKVFLRSVRPQSMIWYLLLLKVQCMHETAQQIMCPFAHGACSQRSPLAKNSCLCHLQWQWWDHLTVFFCMPPGLQRCEHVLRMAWPCHRRLDRQCCMVSRKQRLAEGAAAPGMKI